jgi:hypothetical protein
MNPNKALWWGDHIWTSLLCCPTIHNSVRWLSLDRHVVLQRLQRLQGHIVYVVLQRHVV